MACRCGRPAACVRKLTFTAWINQCLFETGLKVQDLEKDLGDGLVLLKLIETLFPGSRMSGRYYASPKSQIQKIQNLTIALRFLKEEEKIQLKGITAGDILDGNTKQTLQLVWLLILHYHIDCRSHQHSSEPALQRKKMCKQSMLVWVNAVLPGRNITNFTTDWTSGDNLVALINFCKPGFVSPQANPHERLSQAMQVAQKALNVPPVLSPDDLFVDQPDEVSVMVYLSYFCRIGSPGERALLQWVQQVIPSQSITNLTTDWMSGLNLGALVNKLTHNGFPQFKRFRSNTPLANTQESMKRAEELLKIPPSVYAESLSSDDLGYLAKLAYLVQFYAAHKGQPVVMKVDISKIQESPINRGEEKGSKVVWIDVDCSNAGTAEIKAIVSTDAGKEINVSVTEMPGAEAQYRIKFVVEEGVQVYTITITYGEEEVSGSPFRVNLAEADAAKVQPLGTETSTEWKESKSVVLTFDTKEAGYGKLTAKASGDSAGSVPVQLVPKPRGGFDIVFIPPIPDIYLVDVQWGKFMALAKGYSCGTIPIEFQQDSKRDFKLAFEPPTPDVYTVDVMCGGEPVPGSPFTINLLPPATPDKVETGDPVFGVVGENVDLPVDLTHAGPGVLTATCTGEKVGKVETTVLTISKKLYQVTFLPTEIDIYHLNVFFNGFHIKGSPYNIDLTRKRRNDPLPQPTLEREIGSPTIIEVPSNNKAKISVTAFGDKTGPYGTIVQKNPRGIYEVTIDPKIPDIYTINIQLDNIPVPECCYVISYVSRAVERCQIVTDLVELQKVFDTNCEIQLTVSTAGADKGPLEARVESPDGKKYDVVLNRREDEERVYDISYVPRVTGTHYLKITWEGNDIPHSPLPIRVTDFTKVMNFSHGKLVSLSIDIPKDAKENDIKGNVVHTASGEAMKYTGRYSRGKYHITFYPKQSGMYIITVFIKDRELPSSLHVIRSGVAPNPQKCIFREYSGSAFVGREVTFTIDASSAGSGELNVRATTHSIVLMKRKSKVTWMEVAGTPGVYRVAFTPTTTGQHSLHVTWAGRNIPGSPYSITVLEKPSLDYPTKPIAEVYIMDKAGTPNKVDPIPKVLHGSIGQALLLRVKTSFKHEGILSQIGKGLKSIFSDELRVTATGERTGTAHLHVRKGTDEYYYADFVPTEKDRYDISVQYDNEEVVNSPITAVFGPPETDPTKVEIVEMTEKECYIEQEIKFEVKTSGAGVGPLKVLAQAPGADDSFPVRVKEEEKNRFIVRYIPRTKGKHILHLLWGKTAIRHSPVTIEVKELPVVPPGQPVVHEISARSWKLNDIDSTGTHLDTRNNYRVERKQKKGKYVFSIQPDEPGTYEIALSVKGKNICRPFRFKYERPSRPEKVVVFDVNERAAVNEVVYFKIDVSEAGIGPLNIRAVKGPGRTDTNITSFRDGLYTISFSASAPGKYWLKIMWSGKEIPASPLAITFGIDDEYSSSTESLPACGANSPDIGSSTPARHKGSVTNGNNTVIKKIVKDVEATDTTIRKPLSWVIDITEYKGKLEVTAIGEKTGPAEIFLSQVQEREYRVTFRPTKSDTYSISILVNGKHVADSPHTIKYEVPETNVREIKIEGWGKINSLTAIGQTVHFLVNTQDAGVGELKVNAKPPNSKTETHTIEIDEHDEKPAIYTGSYTPLIVGVHSLELLFSQIPIPGTPLQLTVCDPKAVRFIHASQTLVRVGQSITMDVDASKAGSDDLSASCEGTNCGKVSVSITSTKVKGKFEISFKPMVKDLYTLMVKLGRYHIKGSPFKFNLNSIPVQKVIVSGPQIHNQPGGPITLNINTSGLPRGKVTSYCKFEEQTVSVQVKEVSPNVFSLYFEPEEPALYLWSVLFHGQHVPGSPFKIDTRPHANKAVVVAPETGSVRIGQYVYYEVDMSGAGMGVLTATCRGEVSKKIPVQITMVRHGVYRISFLPLSFDKYTLYIQWSGKEVPNSPFVFDIKPHTIGKDPTEIPFILPRVEDMSAVKVICTGQKYGVIAVNLVQVSANNYRITFKPQGPDLYTISVFYNGAHVNGSPFNLDLRVPDEAKGNQDFEVPHDNKGSQKPGGYNVVIGTAFIVAIKSKGTKANLSGAIKATAVGEKVGESRIHVDQYSKRVTFNPKSEDTYTLNISVNGDPVPQSPFIVHYSDPPPDPSRVNIIGLEDILSVLDIHKEVSLVINATKGGSGTLRAEVKGPKQAKVDVQARNGEPETYTLSFIPTAPGLYILSLFWNREHIPNSPLKIRVVDTNSAVKTLPGKKPTIDDMEIKCGPTDIQAYALRRDSTKNLKVTVKQIKTHLYRFIFSHKEAGQYFIHIIVNGEELDVSPIPVYVSQQSWPKKCRVHNLPTVGYLNEEISTIINCTEGGEGTLEAKVTEPNKSERSLAVVDNKNGTFTIVYVPSDEGTYTFNITWSGQVIGGSPYQLVVKKPTQKELPVSEMSVIDPTDQSDPFTGGNISMNSYFTFSIRLTKQQVRSFIAKAKSQDGKYFDFSLISTLGNLFKYSFRPPTPGQYTLEFSLSDHTLKLPQLPSVVFFTEAEVDARELKVLMHSIPGLLLIDRQILFQIDTRLAGNGRIRAILEGPSQDVPDLRIVPTPDTPHFYDVFFTPVVAGTYRLELLWSGTMVPGFPLVFHVTEPTIKYGESSSFDIQIDSQAKNISSFAIHVETGERYEVEIYQVSKRRYQFKFNPKISGKYNLHILVNGKDISGSPFQIKYDYPPQAGDVVITELQKKMQVGSEVKFFINTQRAGNGNLSIRTSGPEHVEMQLTEYSPGVYKAEFIPGTTGEYTIIITWSGEEVPNSPFEIVVTDMSIPLIPGPLYTLPPSPHTPPYKVLPSIIESDLIVFGKRHTLGKLSFSIIHHGFPDKLTIRFTGSTELPYKVIKGQRANKYEIDPKTAGKYEMVILWGGSVVGEVYTLYFQLPKTISGFNMQDQVLQVGKSYQFTITTDDISTGVMEISCMPRDAADIVCTAVTSTQYQCSLIPRTTGDVEIAVSYNGFQIQGSPFVVHFKAATAFSCKFGLQSEGIEINDISAVLESIATQQPIPLSLQQLFGGECNLDFVPTEGDEYKLTITCGLKIKRETMAGSPFNLTYLTGQGGASMCRVEGGISGGVVGEWSKFAVNCEGAGSGKLAAEISGEGAEVKVVSLSEYMYEVHYRISAAGTYQFRLLWGGQDIPGSPFSISAKLTTSSPSITLHVPSYVEVTKNIEIDCEIEVESSEDLSFEATTSFGTKIMGTLTSTEQGFHASIPTGYPGVYSIAAYYKGQPILPKPSKVVVFEQPVPVVCY